MNPILRITVKHHVAHVEIRFDPGALKFIHVLWHLERAEEEFVPDFLDSDDDLQFLSQRDQIS